MNGADFAQVTAEAFDASALELILFQREVSTSLYLLL